jgi:hypothetical protein
MKLNIKQFLPVVALCVGISAASAIPIEIPATGQDIAKTGGISASDDFASLQNVTLPSMSQILLRLCQRLYLREMRLWRLPMWEPVD